ncbi:MAG: 1-acyl-sn-glycerol-3-phosphate acyltransferase, partial [Bacilli bacterium]
MKSKRSQTKHVVKFRHRFFYGLARILLAWIFRLHANFHSKHYHLKGKGPYIIVSNHTSALDPILLATSTDIPIYYVASEII